MISYVEYQWFNGCHSLDDSDFVQTYFMGDSVGYSVLYAVKDRMVEIGSYVPGSIQSLRYARTIKDGLYVIGTIDEHATDLRCNTIQPAPFS